MVLNPSPPPLASYTHVYFHFPSTTKWQGIFHFFLAACSNADSDSIETAYLRRQLELLKLDLDVCKSMDSTSEYLYRVAMTHRMPYLSRSLFISFAAYSNADSDSIAKPRCV